MNTWRPGIVFIGMETSGEYRRRFQAMGFETYSADLLPSEDGGEAMTYGFGGLELGCHIVGDAFEVLETLWGRGLWPDFSIWHPDCTHVTGAAAWAFKDPDFSRYPGVGYHQKVKPGTLTGEARREAREKSRDQFRKIRGLDIPAKVIENPVGGFSEIDSPTETLQPFEFGDDASKRTCHWYYGESGEVERKLILPRDPAKFIRPTLRSNGKSYYANQTDTGQNRLSPGDERWKDRSRTYPGIADAGAAHWSQFIWDNKL